MLRRLLACLALLTGLAAAGAPAQAEVVSAVASRIEASAEGATAVRRTAELAVARPLPSRAFAEASTARPMLESPPAIPTVQLGSDRARE